MTSCMISLSHLRVPCYKHFHSNWHQVMGTEMFYEITIVDTINGFVCIRIVGGLSFLCYGTPMFNPIFCIQLNLKFKF